MHSNSNIESLLKKLIEKSITEDELIILKEWSTQDKNFKELLNAIENNVLLLEDVKIWYDLNTNRSKLLKSLESKTIKKINYTKRNQINWFHSLNIAAALCLLFGVSYFGYHYLSLRNEPIIIHDLNPGISKAKITLSNGKTISLRDDQEGIVIGENLNYEDGTLIDASSTKDISYAIIETPKGGHYNIKMADGTMISLNAQSKLKYPINFNGLERTVELDGEAFFDVKKLNVGGKNIPFRVKTTHQEVNVLGTKFNITAYNNDHDKPQLTTLVEGEVEVHNESKIVSLSPGDQSRSTLAKLTKQRVDVERYVAWVNNKFIFDDTDLRDALDVLSRWYDFEYIVENPQYNVQIYANISRLKNFREVLGILKMSGIKYRLENYKNQNKLIIMN